MKEVGYIKSKRTMANGKVSCQKLKEHHMKKWEDHKLFI